MKLRKILWFKYARQFKASKLLALVLIILVLSGFSTGFNIARATTNTSDFSTSSDYTYDNTKIEFSDGKAQLATTGSPSWYDASWTYRKQIIIDYTKVGGTLTDFPVLISRTDTEWKDVASGGYVGQSDGGDFLFTSSDGTTALNYQIEKYTNTTGELVAWVKVPSLSSVADTVLYVYYGNASVADQQNPTGVWDSNYQTVLHLNESPANNSTTHANSVTGTNSVTPYNLNSIATSTTNGTGKIGGDDVFDGTDDYLDYNSNIPVPEVGNTQQGIATDGTYMYISNSTTIYKYTLAGVFVASSTPISTHLGGIDYTGGYIYAPESACPLDGSTSTDQHIYKYDTNLQKVAEYDISDHFTVCAGAIAYYDDNFYVGESYGDSAHFDRIVKYDSSFNYVTEYTTTNKCLLGINGLEYLPNTNMFRIMCHSQFYYDVNTSFGTTPSLLRIPYLNQQDAAYLNSSTILYNDRSAEVIRVVHNNSFNISTEYTAQLWFKIDGGAGTRRLIMETTPQWSISIEVSQNDKLKYSVKNDTDAGSSGLIIETNVIPTTGTWHNVTVVYKQGNYSKIYYDGSEITASAGTPTSSHYPITGLNIGTYRTADARFFNGGIDEVRISNAVRSDSWISTEYNNQNSPSTFYSVGSASVVYPTSNPTIIPTTATTFTSLSGFTETSTLNGGQIKYQVSNDNGSTWNWYNSGWTSTVSGYTESNVASDINTNISSFLVGAGQFLFKAFLHSDGTQQIQLDAVDVNYINDDTPPSTPVATPNAGIYNVAQSVTLSADGSDSIRYSKSGIPASCSSDTLYADPISVPTTETIYVRACDTAGNSSTASFAYTMISRIGSGQYISTIHPVVQSNTVTTTQTTSSLSSFAIQQLTTSRTLALKSRGEAVRILQEFLKNQGTDIYPQGTIDGIFGKQTLQAVKNFQAKHSLVVDGIVGPNTKEVIRVLN